MILNTSMYIFILSDQKQKYRQTMFNVIYSVSYALATLSTS